MILKYISISRTGYGQAGYENVISMLLPVWMRKHDDGY